MSELSEQDWVKKATSRATGRKIKQRVFNVDVTHYPDLYEWVSARATEFDVAKAVIVRSILLTEMEKTK